MLLDQEARLTVQLIYLPLHYWPMVFQCIFENMTDSQSLWYFAYGSNMSETRIKQRGVVYTERIKGKLKGYKLAFNKRSKKYPHQGFANVMLQEATMVRGVLYRTDEASLEHLDHFEGYPEHYTRQILPIDIHDNGQVDAIVYLAQPEHLAENLEVTSDYLDFLLKGKDLWGEALVCQVRIALEGNAVSVIEFNAPKNDNGIPVWVDGCKAWLEFVLLDRIKIRFEEPHPEGRDNGEFITKYFLMESDGCLEWGHHGGCFKIQHRKV
jgi:gamma-glutamylcyclotransferase